MAVYRIHFQLRKAIKYLLTFLLVVLMGIQFIPISLNHSMEVTADDFIRLNKVPKGVARILKASCYDCHSNNTNYPWYGLVQPTGWFLEKHIQKGKSALNFSEFGSYSTRRQNSNVRAVISQVKSGEMPLPYYSRIHGDARLTNEEKKAVIDYFNSLLDGSTKTSR